MSNPLLQIKNFIRQQGGNPEKLLINFLNQNKNSNPVLNNLVQKAKVGDVKSVETFARNIYNQTGGNFDKDLENFKKFFNS